MMAQWKRGKMSDILFRWFSGNGFLPLGHNYQWAPELLWTYVGADIVMGLVGYIAAAALLYFPRKRPGVQFHWIFPLFSVALFIFGTSHLIETVTIWHPMFRLDASVKALSAVACACVAVLLLRVLPRMMRMPGSRAQQDAIRQLEHEIAERKHAEQALRESQALLRELAAYQERIREDERKRIAREIHDDLGQNLLALRLDVSSLHERAGERHVQLHKRAAAALEHIDTTMKSIRTIMNNLRPSVLDLGLQAAIEWQVGQFRQRNGICCELLMTEESIAASDEQATAIFRILQESLTNVGRHARASHVRIELRVEGGQLAMVVRDNGVGMYPGDRRKMHRFGLVGMAERVNMLGGQLEIESIPGRGTVLSLTIPIDRAAAHAESATAAV
jgi:signal transduction histidine kinase